MSAPPVPPRPFDYDHPPPPTAPPVPPLPADFKPGEASPPHYEDPLVAPRPQKLQPDLPNNISQALHEQAAMPAVHAPNQSSYNPFPRPVFNVSYSPDQNPPAYPPAHRPPMSRGPSPSLLPRAPTVHRLALLPPPFASPALQGPHHQHSLSGSFANMTLAPRQSSPLSIPAATRDGPPSLTAPLPTVAILSVQQSAIQQPGGDPARKVIWCRDVFSLVDRAQQLRNQNANPTSTDGPAVGPAQIDDPEVQKLVNVAVPVILQISQSPSQGPMPPYLAEALYMRALCASTGLYPQFIPHDPRNAFRDFERAAKAGHHAAWFKLGREYENFGDLQHAKDCFERGMKHGVESCFYRLGMAHLMGQLGFHPDPQTAIPLLNRAATLATIDVPQPAYVYGLLLLDEFSHVSIPPHLFQPFLPPGVTPPDDARRHLERAAYLNFAPAQYKLGHAYEFASAPFPFDALLSVQYYSLASQQGEIEADMALSKWFLCGAEGSFDKDEGLAWTFAEKAARKGLPSAEFALGYYSEVGVGGPVDIENARKWYIRAAEHGNADASDRLKALSQPTPQALSREQHENLTDSKLVRKRTQAKQRSDAVGGPAVGPVAAMPAAQRSQIVSNIRKGSIGPGAMLEAAAGAGASAYGASGPSAYRSTPTTNSPPNMGQNAPLPQLNERRQPTGPHGAMASPGPGMNPRPQQSGPRPGGPPMQDGRRHPSGSVGPASSPRPAGTPPLRRPGGGPGPQSQPPPQQAAPAPLSRPPPKGPQTFAEMGIATQKVEDDSNCVIM
ncbi:HCP-like protein [Epithele typhae]|uniref:HCP-like protein n=1 Tax=Epithele typhae TaxID=378194 RepID=UPI002008A687|nr:HCP-like protein [Epithele typhae]KAH9910439.1 HCP-like protein [Epithele typhae]